ncbi:metallopeptidase (peptidase family M3) [Colletotrichum sojae]|uniref:Metallopeptidase (Peptidase family M3) n=1 Tax=Colletotrichum sojae TaxID=2175907 RepID=A0A8H6J1Q5_9PEZI|nr:metallopeptidase (peptidase family M3) [Colletotrichum sojae]
MSRKSPQPLLPLLSATDLVPTIQRLLAAEASLLDSLTSSISPQQARYATVILPIQESQDATQSAASIFSMLRYSGPPDKATRDAVAEAQKLWVAADAERLKRADVFALVQAVWDKNEEGVDEEGKRVVEDMWLEFRHAGHGVLDREGVEGYLARRTRIEELKRAFQGSLSEDDGGIWIDEDELAGVPETEASRWRRDAGRVFVKLDRAGYDAVLSYAHSSETRRRMHLAYEDRLRENVGLYKQILLLRDENARVLGYDSHAAFRIRRRTAPSTEWVGEFLNKLSGELLPHGRREIARLGKIKKQHLERLGEKDGQEIMAWDYYYYARLLEQSCAVDQDLVSEWFPLRHTLQSMLDLFHSFLGLDFIPVPEKDLEGKIWAEEVEVWAVWEGRGEQKGEFVGYLYADVIYREGKYRGNCNVNLQCGYTKPDGSRVHPATILMCSFNPPTTSSCALLKHREVVTLFHGHALHDLVSRTRHTRFHGTRVTPDFGEAPSTMLESWCWMPGELVRMSRHFTRVDERYMTAWKEAHPGEEIPAEKMPVEIAERVAESRGFNRALWFLRQLVFARFDLEVNTQPSTQALRELDEVALFNELQDSLSLRPSPDQKGFGFVHSNHLISLYDAGYYSYLSAQAFAADFFEANFAKDPRDPEAWERYRRGVLEFGGSKGEMEIMRGFLGREPGTGALLRSLGLREE